MEAAVSHAQVVPLARLEPAGVWLYGFLVVALVGSNTGGHNPTTWGWCALLTLWLAVIVLVTRERLELTRLDLAFTGSVALLTGWTVLTTVWSSSVTSSMHEAQRGLAYLGVVTAGLVVARRATATALAGGVLGGVALLSLYALGTRLLPDRLGSFDSVEFGYRLATPITYWNGLGIFAVMGVVLALGFAARGRSLVTRALAAAVLPALALTTYFTFSRGAWMALGVGLAAAVLVDPRRLQLLAAGLLLAPWSVVALTEAQERKPLTTTGTTLAAATDAGHSLALLLVLLSACSAVTAVVFALVERRLRVPQGARAAFAAALVAALALGVAAVWVEHGSPWQLANRGWDSFQAPPKSTGPDLSDRVFQLSNNGRVVLWETLWDTFEDEPALGSGAGTFWQQWAANADRGYETTQGHSLYAEALGETGAIGLVILLAALLTPFIALGRARRTALGPVAAAAYVAWLAHSGIDWDWELAGVTVAALLCAVVLVVSGRDEFRAMTTRRTVRLSAALACAVAALLAVPQLLADTKVDDGWDALPADGRGALDDARDAERWVPWSSEPKELRGDAWRSLGKLPAARAAYLSALDLEPDDWRLWAKLADVTEGAERTAALRRANALNPRVDVPTASS